MRTAQRAFTLIELLIVVSLITIITGALLPSFNNYIDTQNVKQAQEQIKDELRTLQNKALNGEEASYLVGGSTEVEYWGIQFDSGSSTYKTFVSANTSCPGTVGTDRGPEKTSSLLPGNSEVVSPAQGCAFFSFANGDAMRVNLGPGNSVIVGPEGADAADNTCRRVIIHSMGLIESTSDAGCS